MLIGIDSSRVTKTYLTGTEYYSIEIIKALSSIDDKNRYLLYSPSNTSLRLGNLGENFSQKIMPFPKFWSQIRLSWEMIFKKPDVLFVPSHLIPIYHPKNTVVTLHDLGFKKFPELYPPKELIYHNWGMNFSAKHAKYIITPSEYTKRDLIKTYSLDPEKISVIWHGFDRDLFKPGDFSQKKPYIFFIGRLEEKKNIIGMIRAYAFLRKEKNIKHQFLLAGKPGFGYDVIEKEIDNLPGEIKKDIKLLGYIKEADYVKKLQEADIFLFTTFFEGFGMPIIEAMACGTPVITSNRTSMPEIAGNAAILVDPNNSLQIAAAMSKVIHSDGLKKSLILKGRVRSKIFSWEKAAKKTLEVINKAQFD